ncbi:hypothetical protein O3G_MSEX012570 [Manduca sexta]|uniref:Uncharacterized protein n=1 Tax=Manduca sexta TaxID=7130 RepID=A0A921ZQ32_MANSE|nr:hypothetical protein O3G_MSEX012570 [Manduca sexta]
MTTGITIVVGQWRISIPAERTPRHPKITGTLTQGPTKTCQTNQYLSGPRPRRIVTTAIEGTRETSRIGTRTGRARGVPSGTAARNSTSRRPRATRPNVCVRGPPTTAPPTPGLSTSRSTDPMIADRSVTRGGRAILVPTRTRGGRSTPPILDPITGVTHLQDSGGELRATSIGLTRAAHRLRSVHGRITTRRILNQFRIT